ncbi:MAG: 2-dehydropantoate 2-reductase [Candidatus Aceula meridiana]|nr:2-dehydropantoate 2-reductase [Candidatus Aceula meridiana]
MHIAVVGAGAIGSVVAAYLHKAGENVTLIGRPDQLAAIEKNGLKINGIRGEEVFHIPVKTKMDEEYPLVIFATKTQDVERAYQDNRDFLENGLVLTTENGVQADNILSGHIEKEKVISSIVMFGATYINPGEVTFNFEGNWIVGKPYMTNDMLIHDIAAILNKAFEVVVSDDIIGMKWLKLFINFNNCLPALIGKSMQETFADMDFCTLSIKILKEGVDIVQKAGIQLTSLPNFPVDRIYGLASMPEPQAAGIMNKTLTTLSQEPVYGSILQSIIRKKKSEIEFINGEVYMLAKQTGTQAPLNHKIVDLVNQVEQSGEFFTIEQVKKEFNL